MKHFLLFITVIMLFGLNTTITAQIKMSSDGYVKIGSLDTPTKNLDIKGHVIFRTVENTNGKLIIDNSGYQGYQPAVYPEVNNTGMVGKTTKAFYSICSYAYPSPSDIKQKENIRDIDNALEIVLRLKGVKYDIKKEYAYNDPGITDADIQAAIEKDRKGKIGFIAQDVYELLPEVIVYDDSSDMYAIDYSKIIPVLVEAIKEQQAIIKSLQSGSSSDKLKSTTVSESQDNITGYDLPILYQNYPNPFNENTRIEYYLTDKVQNASIYIYDMNGTQLKSIPVHLKGYGNVIIYGSELKAGMYMYSLIADGQLISTRQMILTD